MNGCVIIRASLVLLVVVCERCHSEPVVKLKNSAIIGQKISFREHALNQFLGVPYAQPPTGPLRFKKPELIQKYPKEFRALQMPPACMQYSERPFPSYVNSSEKSEDCLYLNIWTPADASPKNKKAVLYWMHGGALLYGSIRLPIYSGIPLAALGDIIVVTVNYRLGSFGFLTSGTEEAPGNIGLWDKLEGLRWVNKYIKYFGGDASRITIAGQSAGSVAVGLFSVSPLAEGLYRRQIMESGSPIYMTPESNTKNLAFSQQIAEKVGCASTMLKIKENSETVLECLRGVDPAVLAEADSRLSPTDTYIPQYGDAILPMHPAISMLKGDFRSSELLIGNNKDEGSSLMVGKFPEIFGFHGEKHALINKSVGSDIILDAFSGFPEPESVARFYLPDSLAEDAGAFVRHQTHTAIGDRFLFCPDVYHAEIYSAKGGRVYFYSFEHRSNDIHTARWLGVQHGAEVPFVFGSPLLRPSSYTPEEQWLSAQMVEIWSSFAKYGQPSMSWPLYSKEEPLTKRLGPGIVTGENGIGPHKNSCDFLRPFFNRLLKSGKSF